MDGHVISGNKSCWPGEHYHRLVPDIRISFFGGSVRELGDSSQCFTLGTHRVVGRFGGRWCRGLARQSIHSGRFDYVDWTCFKKCHFNC